MLRVKEDQILSLRRALNVAGMYGDPGIIGKTKMSAQTVGRIMDGTAVRPQFMFRLLRALLALPDGDLSEEEKDKLKDALERYCQEPPAAAPRAPRAGRAAPVRPAGQALACMVVVLKFVHLRDRRKGRPAYTRSVARLGGQAVEVYSEYFTVRTLYFRDAPDTLELQASRNAGVIDLLPVLPPSLALSGDAGEPHQVEHMETAPGPLSQVAVTILNGIQADGDFSGNEAMGALVPEKCDRVVLVVDMLSVPVAPGGSLHAAPPTAWHRQPVGQTHKDTQLGCAESNAGVFVIDTAEPFGEPDAPGAWPGGRALRARDQVVIRLALNWDALAG